jgi:hypothetical protein
MINILNLIAILTVVFSLRYISGKFNIPQSKLWFGLKPESKILGAVFSILFSLLFVMLSIAISELVIVLMPLILAIESHLLIFFVLGVFINWAILSFVLYIAWLLEFLDIVIWR